MEELTFRFEGGLANNNTLNFYEAARFQYATARLIVKLAQFAHSGTFSQKITEKNNADINIKPHKEGSFDISVLAPLMWAAQDTFICVSISHLISYVFERITNKSSDSEVVAALNSQTEIARIFGQIDQNKTDLMHRALDEINKRDDIIIENEDDKNVLEQRIYELEREKYLSSKEKELARIDITQQQNLISMAAPLIRDMAVPLRRSAKTLKIGSSTEGSTKDNIIYLNQKMADEIELSKVDQHVTPILGDIVQYNKETGWGKARLDISDHMLSFNIPSDIKSRLQSAILKAMGRDKVYLQVYIVRDRASQPTRLIVVGILPTPKL